MTPLGVTVIDGSDERPATSHPFRPPPQLLASAASGASRLRGLVSPVRRSGNFPVGWRPATVVVAPVYNSILPRRGGGDVMRFEMHLALSVPRSVPGRRCPFPSPFISTTDRASWHAISRRQIHHPQLATTPSPSTFLSLCT